MEGQSRVLLVVQTDQDVVHLRPDRDLAAAFGRNVSQLPAVIAVFCQNKKVVPQGGAVTNKKVDAQPFIIAFSAFGLLGSAEQQSDLAAVKALGALVKGQGNCACLLYTSRCV